MAEYPRLEKQELARHRCAGGFRWGGRLLLPILLLCLAAVFLFPMAADAENSSGVCGEELNWKLEDGELSITGCGAMSWYDMGSAPWYPLRTEIQSLRVGEGVTTLSFCAFYNHTSLCSVSLPDTLREIGGMAFYGCSSLSSIAIPGPVSSIGDFCFYGCKGLQTILVDDENAAFCDMDGVLFEAETLLCYPPMHEGERYTVPEGTKQLSACAFSYSSLRQISVPAGVWFIDKTALSDCQQLEAVDVAWDNWYYASIDGVLYSYDKTTLICCPARKSGSSYRIPASVREVSIRAFAGCTELVRVDVMGDLDTLGSLAFAQCASLKSVVFHGNAPAALGYAPIPESASVYHLEGKRGWDEADPEAWNAPIRQWMSAGSLLKQRGRLTK